MKFSSSISVAALAATVLAMPEPVKECKVVKYGEYKWQPEPKAGGYPKPGKQEPESDDKHDEAAHWDEYKPVEPEEKESHYWGDYKQPSDDKEVDDKFDNEHKGKKFTSVWSIKSVPEEVVLANGTAAPGEAGSVGYWNFGINSEEELICWVRSPLILILLEHPS
jgi:hypothetical protein